MATNVLSTIYSLAAAVKGAYDGVQGNREQCKLLNDQVQNVATALRGLSAATVEGEAVKEAISSLTETLRAAADLIEGFKKKHWLKKVLWHSSVTQKFEGLFGKLDCVLTVCGFALNVGIIMAIFFFTQCCLQQSFMYTLGVYRICREPTQTHTAWV